MENISELSSVKYVTCGALCSLCPSPRIIRMVKPRMGRTEHVARMGEKMNAYGLLVGKSEGKNH
jgi:hypothetical protein